MSMRLGCTSFLGAPPVTVLDKTMTFYCLVLVYLG